MTPLKRFNIVCASALASLSIASGAYALTDFNTVIENKAGATYLDSQNQVRHTQSNTVKTTIQAVAAVNIVSDQDKFATAGNQMSFYHTVTNTGNNNDNFNLTITPTGSAISGFTIMPDTNNDGVPDVGATPLVNGDPLPSLAPNETYNFVILVDVDAAASPGDVGSLDVSVSSVSVINGTSEVSPGSGTDSNTDTLTVSANPIVEVTKQISDNAGDSPDGPFRITLMYNNISNTDMSLTDPGVVIKDILPTGMRFNGGVEWSIPANNSPVSAEGNLAGATSTFNGQDLVMTTCIAPNASCPTNDIVTFTLDGLEGMDSALVSFLVNIDSDLNAQTLENSALYGYDEDNGGSVIGAELEKYTTNIVPFTINPKYAVIANNGNCDLGTDNNCIANNDSGFETVTLTNVPQGSMVKFENYIWNLGNAVDTFDITTPSDTFPIGTLFLLMRSDGVTPLTDTDGSGDVDTGPIPPKGEACGNAQILSSDGYCGYKVVLTAFLPPSVSSGSFNVTKLATSTNDGTKTNTVIDLIANIVANTVDLTNNFKANTATDPETNCNSASSNCGFGTGPEVNAVTTNTTAPGSTTTFSLFVTNTASMPDSYLLSHSTTGTPFNAGTLPADWSVVFKDTNGNVITTTPVLGMHENFEFVAEVSVPETQTSGVQDIFFRAQSPASLASDIKHEAVDVDSTGICLQINPVRSTRNVNSNGSIDYRLEITNGTNDALNNIEINVTNSLPTKFTEVLFLDSGNGVLDNSDPTITGTPPTIATLGPRQTAIIFVKVFANSNAANGEANTTTLAISTPCGSTTTTVNAELITTVVNTNIQVTKLQAADRGCTGTIDTTPPGNVFTGESFSLKPTECVLYRVVARNIGIETAFNVKISDKTPNFTRHRVIGVLPSLTQGSITSAPSDLGTGDVIAEIGTLESGEEVTLEFAVQIDE